MKEFIEKQGLAYFGHVLGRVYDRILRSFDEWYSEADVVAPARTHSTIHALYEHGELGVTEVANQIRQSHPLVIKWVRQLTELGLVETGSDPADRRRTVLSLTKGGVMEFQTQQAARAVVVEAFQRLLREADAEDAFAALWRIEKALQRESFQHRLRQEAEVRKTRLDPPCCGERLSGDD